MLGALAIVGAYEFPSYRLTFKPFESLKIWMNELSAFQASDAVCSESVTQVRRPSKGSVAILTNAVSPLIIYVTVFSVCSWLSHALHNHHYMVEKLLFLSDHTFASQKCRSLSFPSVSNRCKKSFASRKCRSVSCSNREHKRGRGLSIAEVNTKSRPWAANMSRRRSHVLPCLSQ